MIDVIIKKLKEYKINNIISIDNEWKPRRSVVDGDKKLKEFMEQKRIIPNIAENKMIKNKMIETIKDLLNNTDKELNDIRERILKRSEKTIQLDNSLASLDIIFHSIIEVEKDIKIHKESSVDLDLSKYHGNSLYILDRNMGEGYEDVIIDEILQIKNEKKESRNLILIYSSDCGSDYDTHENKIKYLKETYKKDLEEDNELVIAYQLWAIKKVGDSGKLLEDINEMLSKSMYGASLVNIVNFKKETERSAYKDLLMIDIEDLHGTFNDSFLEGDNIILSFDRIMKALINKNYNCESNWTEEIIKSYQYLIEYEKRKIEALKNSSLLKQIDTSGANEDDLYKVFKTEHVRNKLMSCILNSSEYAIADYSVNRFFSDISTGDIFRFKRHDLETWEYCMIISQECNNVIRMPISKVSDNPGRNNTEIKLLMFECDEIPNGKITNSKLGKLNSSIATRIWPICVDKKHYSLSPTERTITIDANILDVCSLNENGKAIKDVDISKSLRYKGYQSEAYFKSFYNKQFWKEFDKKGKTLSSKYSSIFEDYLKECGAAIECNTKCFEEGVNEKYLNSMQSKFFDDTISMIYGIKYSNNEFVLERVCRIEPKRTLLAIQDYIYKLSRTGAEPVISFSCKDIS